MACEGEAYVKLWVLFMLDEGLERQVLLASLGISLQTIVNYKSTYSSVELEGSPGTHYVPYKWRLSDEELERLDSAVDDGMFVTCAEVAHCVEREFGMIYSVSAVRTILGKFGFVWKNNGFVSGGLDIDSLKSFLKVYGPFLKKIDEGTEVD